MEYAKKMALVPIADHDDSNTDCREPMIGCGDVGNIVDTSIKKKTVQTPGDRLSRLDTELYKILKSRKYDGDDSRKWKDYMQVLQQYLFLNGTQYAPEEPSAIEPSAIEPSAMETTTSAPLSTAVSDDAIISSVPVTYKRIASSLLRYLHTSKEAKKNVYWDEKGCVTINGTFLKDSNIVDLINDAVRSRKGVTPYGRLQFITSLRSSGIPREFVGNDTLWRLGKFRASKKRPHAPDTENTSDDDEGNTRFGKRIRRMTKMSRTAGFSKWISV